MKIKNFLLIIIGIYLVSACQRNIVGNYSNQKLESIKLDADSTFNFLLSEHSFKSDYNLTTKIQGSYSLNGTTLILYPESKETTSIVYRNIPEKTPFSGNTDRSEFGKIQPNYKVEANRQIKDIVSRVDTNFTFQDSIHLSLNKKDGKVILKYRNSLFYVD
ncbi:MAG: hypothetical protein R2879_07815 [Saprospiraceae bacterium]